VTNGASVEGYVCCLVDSDEADILGVYRTSYDSVAYITPTP
jgi:hypothetical protein